MTGERPAEPVREVLIARHGVAHANVARIIAGPACTGLTDHGRTQAATLAHRLAEQGGIRSIYASTTPRAWETAQILGKVLGIDPQERPALRVPDPGAAEGHTWVLAREQWPADPNNPTRALPDDGETWESYLDRAADDLDDILDTCSDGRTLIVGHTETVAAMYALLLGVRKLGRLKADLQPCGLITWRAVAEPAGAVYPKQRWSLVGVDVV